MRSCPRIGAIVAGIAVAVAVTGSAQAAAPSSAGCVGQFFSSHAGIVPTTGGKESVGGFVSVSAREDGRAFGQEISSGRDLRARTAGSKA
jgi:hypothetical protein